MNVASDAKRVLSFAGHSIPPGSAKTRAGAEGRDRKDRFYKPLPKEFRRDRFTYRQVVREGNAAIYEQTWGGRPDAAPCFEVIRVKQRGGFEIDGRFVQPAEVYPASKLWGTDAFSLTDRDAAFAKLRELA